MTIPCREYDPPGLWCGPCRRNDTDHCRDPYIMKDATMTDLPRATSTLVVVEAGPNRVLSIEEIRSALTPAPDIRILDYKVFTKGIRKQRIRRIELTVTQV